MTMGTKNLRACSLLSATGMSMDPPPCYVGFLILAGYFGVAFFGYSISMSMKDENLLGEMEYGGFFAISMGLLSVSFPFFSGLFSLVNLTSPRFESCFLFLFQHIGTDYSVEREVS